MSNPLNDLIKLQKELSVIAHKAVTARNKITDACKLSINCKLREFITKLDVKSIKQNCLDNVNTYPCKCIHNIIIKTYIVEDEFPETDINYIINAISTPVTISNNLRISFQLSDSDTKLNMLLNIKL